MREIGPQKQLFDDERTAGELVAAVVDHELRVRGLRTNRGFERAGAAASPKRDGALLGGVREVVRAISDFAIPAKDAAVVCIEASGRPRPLRVRTGLERHVGDVVVPHQFWMLTSARNYGSTRRRRSRRDRAAC